MDRTAINIRQGEHGLVVGQTQSGKSIWLTGTAAGFDVGTVVILDPKSDPDALLPNCAVVTSATDVIRHLPGRVCWRPRRRDLGHLQADWDRICIRRVELAEHGYSSTVVIHELADLGDAHHIGQGWRQVITQGAQIAGGPSRGGGAVGAWMATQRPKNIPVIARTEIRHAVLFALADSEDRAYMAGLMEDRDRPEWSRSVITSYPLPADHSWGYRGPEHRLTLHDPVALKH